MRGLTREDRGNIVDAVIMSYDYYESGFWTDDLSQLELDIVFIDILI